MDSGALLLSLLPFLVGGCNINACWEPLDRVLLNSGTNSTPGYCHKLHEVAKCIASAPNCRGDINYHTSETLVRLHTEKLCSNQEPKKQPPALTPPPPPHCSYSGSSAHLHCGLYGDPHLKTFQGLYQTCRVRGAWPLIDNRYLAVQVTNMPVHHSSPATATTKVTVIIKGTATSCAKEKTYQATAESPLLPYFIDGTDKTGPDESVVLRISEEGANQKVEIYLRYIDTTLIIRRVGDYLGFSGSLPKDILDAGHSEEWELCSKGCPINEQLDSASARGHQLSWSAAYVKCADSSNLEGNGKNNLTDHYLDWCVFDVMTAGNQKDFISAAHLALADVLKLDPESLQNRTVPLELNQLPPASSAYVSSISLSLILVIIFGDFYFLFKNCGF